MSVRERGFYWVCLSDAIIESIPTRSRHPQIAEWIDEIEGQTYDCWFVVGLPIPLKDAALRVLSERLPAPPAPTRGFDA